MEQAKKVDSTKIADLKEITDARELERVLGIPRGTWRYWAHIGEGPPSFKLGKRRVYRRSAIEAWIAEQEAISRIDRAAG